MRLIDADLLEDEVMYLFITITGNPKQHTVVNECKSSFRRMIEEQPTAEPVRGEWIHDINNLYGCSVCGNRETMSHKKKKNFCSNCGADMRKEV